jgi:hypothetical protein
MMRNPCQDPICHSVKQRFTREGGTVLGSARRVVKKGSKLAGRAVSQATIGLTSAPGADTIPLRRIGFGVSMVMDPRGSTLLDALGDDLDERAHTMDRFLNRCSDEELNELMAAFQEAAARRAAR